MKRPVNSENAAKKQGSVDAHKYMDHWIDDSHFHRQSGPFHLPWPCVLYQSHQGSQPMSVVFGLVGGA